VIVHLAPGEPWEHEASQQTNVAFASASSPQTAELEVSVNGEVVEFLYLTAPHSWWPSAGNPLCETLKEGDVLRIEATEAPVAVRLDLA
jgi:hypothetical protein